MLFCISKAVLLYYHELNISKEWCSNFAPLQDIGMWSVKRPVYNLVYDETPFAPEVKNLILLKKRTSLKIYRKHMQACHAAAGGKEKTILRTVA